LTTSRHPPPSAADPRLAAEVPHNARIWNYWLGGTDNFPADRAVAEAAMRAYPEIVTVARESRKALARIVRFLAGDRGIRQFLDIGTGLPTADNTHTLAQRIAPASRIVYVDNDPLVLAHSDALLSSAPEGATTYLEADIREPEDIVAKAAGTLDFDQPVGLVLFGVLGAASTDTDEAYGIVQRLLAHLAPGSYLAINDSIHGDADGAADAGGEDAHFYTLRHLAEIARFFDGTELVEPGLVPNTFWRPEEAAPKPLPAHCGVGFRRGG